MICAKGYYSASIRGPLGNAASDEEIKKNTEAGVSRGAELQSKFGSTLNLYVPHAHDEAIQWLLRNACLSVDDVLEADCAILQTCDFIIVDGFHSGGVKIEIEYSESHNIPIIYLKKNMEKSVLEIHTLINQILRKKNNG